MSLASRVSDLATRISAEIKAVRTALAGKVDTTDPRLSDARTPTTHTHPLGDITGLDTALAGKSDTTHTHSLADAAITGTLPLAKMPAHTHGVADLTATGTRSATTYLRGDGAWATPTNTTYAAITQAEAEDSASAVARLITGQRLYQAIIKWARPSTWVPSWADVTGKPTTFPPEAHGHALTDANITGVLPVAQMPAHTHTTAQVTGLDAALSGKADATHSHTTAQVTGLDTALSGKANTVHGHALTDANITGVLPLAQMPTHDHDDRYYTETEIGNPETDFVATFNNGLL